MEVADHDADELVVVDTHARAQGRDGPAGGRVPGAARRDRHAGGAVRGVDGGQPRHARQAGGRARPGRPLRPALGAGWPTWRSAGSSVRRRSTRCCSPAPSTTRWPPSRPAGCPEPPSRCPVAGGQASGQPAAGRGRRPGAADRGDHVEHAGGSRRTSCARNTRAPSQAETAVAASVPSAARRPAGRGSRRRSPCWTAPPAPASRSPTSSPSRRVTSSECQVFLPKSCAGSIRIPSGRTPAATARSASAGHGRDHVGDHVGVRDPVRPGPRRQPAGVRADQPGAGRRGHLGELRVGPAPGVVEQVGARAGSTLGRPRPARCRR